MHNKKEGGEKLGEGKSGVVYDMCDAVDYENNIETFCNYFGEIVNDTIQIDLQHVSNTTGGAFDTYTITDKNDISNFIVELSKSENHNLIAKVYKNTFRFGLGVNAKRSYDEEVNGVLALINVLGLDVIKEHTPIKFFSYKNKNVIGLQITTRSIFQKTIYVSFSEKCTNTLEDMCKNIESKLDIKLFNDMISSVLKTLVVLQQRDIGHGDLKPGNIMFCQNVWKLIDWNMYRELKFSTLNEKDGMLPKHRGSSPFYYMLHNFTYRDIMIQNYVNDFMMAQFHKDMYDDFFSFLKKSVESFKHITLPKADLFNMFKYHGDLHSIGLIIYALNKLYLNNDKIEGFSNRLCIYNDEMILNAIDANDAFQRLITDKSGGKARIRYEKRTRKSLIELAKARNLQIPKNATKAVIIDFLRGRQY